MLDLKEKRNKHRTKVIFKPSKEVLKYVPCLCLPQSAEDLGKSTDSPVMTQMEALEGAAPTFTDNSSSESVPIFNSSDL